MKIYLQMSFFKNMEEYFMEPMLPNLGGFFIYKFTPENSEK